METRQLRAAENPVVVETRADGKEYIGGRAIVYNQWSQTLGFFRERILPGALDNCDISDVIARFNHDNNCTLARTPDKLTLELRTDGLWYFFEYDPTDPDHVRVRAKIIRGDCRGSSFAFDTAKDGAKWTTFENDDTKPIERDVSAISKLYDVAPVINPAYLQTSAAMSKRSIEEAKAECDAYLNEHRSGDAPETPESITQTAPETPPVPTVPLSVRLRQIQLIHT